MSYTNASKSTPSEYIVLTRLVFLGWFQSPDGDIIDCVPSHHQPAFDHPMLQGQRPMVLSSIASLILIIIIPFSKSKVYANMFRIHQRCPKGIAKKMNPMKIFSFGV